MDKKRRKAVRKDSPLSVRITKSERNLLDKEKERRKIDSDGRCIMACVKECAKNEKQRKRNVKNAGEVAEEVKNLCDVNNLVAKMHRYQITHEDAKADKEFNDVIAALEEVGKNLCDLLNL